MLSHKKYTDNFFKELAIHGKFKHLRDARVGIAIFYFLKTYGSLFEIVQQIFLFMPYNPRPRVAPLLRDVTLYGVQGKSIVKPELVKPELFKSELVQGKLIVKAELVKPEFIVSLPIVTQQSLVSVLAPVLAPVLGCPSLLE